MKAEELMRFDWVHLTDDDTPRQVDWIRSGEVGLFWSQTVTPPYLEPIPLTEELLIKNGWHRYYFGAKDTSDKVSINYELENDHTLFLCHYPDEDCFCSAFGLKRIEFRYVHQLQHALRLCGIDKEIVL